MNTHLVSLFPIVHSESGMFARATFTPIDHEVRADIDAVFMDRAGTQRTLARLGATPVEQALDDLATGTAFQRPVSTDQATAISADGWPTEDRGVERRAS